MGQGRLHHKYCSIILDIRAMAELSQEALAAALHSIFEAKGLLIAIDEGILVEEATAAPAAAPSAAPAAALAAAPAAALENVPSQQDQQPDDSGDEDEQQQVIGLGHASDLGEDLPKWDRSVSEFEGFDVPGGFQGVGGVVGRGLGVGEGGLILRCRLLGPVICHWTTIPLTVMRSLMLM